MIAGLPGTGLGGIFYLIASIWVIAREGVRLVRGDSMRWARRAVMRLALMTCGIFVVLAGTYWILGEFLAQSVPNTGVDVGLANDTLHRAPALPPIFVATLPVQIGTIVALLSSVEGLHWFIKRRSSVKTILTDQAQTTKV